MIRESSSPAKRTWFYFGYLVTCQKSVEMNKLELHPYNTGVNQRVEQDKCLHVVFRS